MIVDKLRDGDIASIIDHHSGLIRRSSINHSEIYHCQNYMSGKNCCYSGLLNPFNYSWVFGYKDDYIYDVKGNLIDDFFRNHKMVIVPSINSENRLEYKLLISGKYEAGYKNYVLHCYEDINGVIIKFMIDNNLHNYKFD